MPMVWLNEEVRNFDEDKRSGLGIEIFCFLLLLELQLNQSFSREKKNPSSNSLEHI
jgi:hypothetical protein